MIILAHPGGRPPKFTNVDDLQLLIDNYFNEIENSDEIADIEGMCMRLDISRETLNQYQQKEEFSDAIKRAKTKIFQIKKQMAMKGRLNPIIFIFDAKNNHNYVDKQEIEQKTDSNINITFDIPRPKQD